MELTISIILGFMIIGAIYALHAKDLLSAVIAMGIVGYGLVICFLLLKAPDLAIVQIVVETITLVIMVAVVLDSTRKEVEIKLDRRTLINTISAFVIFAALFYFFTLAIRNLDPLGAHTLRMSEAYVNGAIEKTGSVNLVTGVLFDFRAYDTLGEAVILYTAALGVLTLLRIKGKK
ncbi:MAG: hydrogen gas-evolving membrane-bound hydrogenase subunit E [Bacteroidota bacterium]